MAEHSPLPFKQIESRFDDERKQLIVDASGIYVGKLQYDPDRDSANAAFIVRAVNAHQDLVDALRSYVELEEAAAPYSSSPMRQRARAALAKAKGGDDA